MYNKKVTLLIIGIVLALTGGIGSQSRHVSAQSLSAPLSLSSIGECGTESNQFNVLLKKVPAGGQVYMRLNNTSESSGSSIVYFQSFSDSQCHLIGTSNPVYGSWSKVGSYNLDTTVGGAFVVIGSGLGALPYQAAVSLLILPNPAVCAPVTNCQVTYRGYQGVLSPQIISGATDQVAVYVASPLSGVGYSKVTYYSDNQFLYDSTHLEPINRNYLGGGVHNVSTQISLSNQQTITINQTINMGSDYADILAIRSLVYRTQNKALVFAISAMAVVILLLLLWIARLLYKHHQFKLEHGLDKLNIHHGLDNKGDPPEDSVVVS